jgi:hypothetical protein
MSIQALGLEISAPGSTVTSAASATAGSLGNGNYQYKVTFVGLNGETLASAASVAVNPNPSTSLLLTGIPVGDVQVSSRKLYRTASGGSTYFLLTTINDNVTTSYTDSAADASITGNATEPLFNTAVSRETMKGYFDMSLPFIATSDSITASTTQTQVGGTAVLFKNYVRVVTGNANDAIRLPPIASVSIGVAITVGNASANALQVFPSTGQTINSGAANASVTQAASVTKTYVSSSATNWLQV